MKAHCEARPRDEKTNQAFVETRQEEAEDPIIKCSMYPQMVGKRRSELTQARQRSTESARSTGRSSGHDTPTRHLSNQQRSAALNALYGKPASGRASVEPRGSGEDDDRDPIVKCSMYPQMVGKRRSELARARTRSVKYYQSSTEVRERVATDRPVHRSTRQQAREYRSRRGSVGLDLSYDSAYDSEDSTYESEDSTKEDRPIRVCMYPQLNYCKIPGKMPVEPGRHDSVLSSDEMLSKCEAPPSQTASSQMSGNGSYRPCSLPHDEYSLLVRRQKMEHAREVLEPHFAHYGSQKGPHVWHGLMKPYQTRNTERRRISKVMYVVRKALKANFDLLSNEYELARHRHTAKTPYCELSDVDGVPLPEALIYDFTRTYQEVQDNAYAPKLTPLPYGEPAQRTWIDERIRQAAALRRVDSGMAMDAPTQHPQLVSKFSWDSDSEGEVYKRKRLTKVKR